MLECQIRTTKSVNKENDKCKHISQETNENKFMCMVVILKESDTVQSLGKPDKIEFLNEPKQSELAKHRHCVNIV